MLFFAFEAGDRSSPHPPPHFTLSPPSFSAYRKRPEARESPSESSRHALSRDVLRFLSYSRHLTYLWPSTPIFPFETRDEPPSLMLTSTHKKSTNRPSKFMPWTSSWTSRNFAFHDVLSFLCFSWFFCAIDRSAHFSPLKNGLTIVTTALPSNHQLDLISKIRPRQNLQKIASCAVFHDLFNELCADVPSSMHLTSFFTWPLSATEARPLDRHAAHPSVQLTPPQTSTAKTSIFCTKHGANDITITFSAKIHAEIIFLQQKQHIFPHKMFSPQFPLLKKFPLQISPSNFKISSTSSITSRTHTNVNQVPINSKFQPLSFATPRDFLSVTDKKLFNLKKPFFPLKIYKNTIFTPFT